MNLENLIESGLLSKEQAQNIASNPKWELEAELSEEDALKIIMLGAQHLRRRIDFLQQQIEQDALTGLATKEHFENQLYRAHKRFLSDRTHAYTLFVFDLDKFKLINDTYGHKAGDDVLRHAGEVIQYNLRPFDLAARLGGDEFAALVNGQMERESAENLIERVGTGLSELVDLTSDNLIDPQVKAQLGISGGFAQPVPNEDAASVLHRADQNMYEMKFSRR